MYEDSENINSEVKQKLEIQFWIETKNAPCLRELKAVKKSLKIKENAAEKNVQQIYHKNNKPKELCEVSSESTVISSPLKFTKMYTSARPETVPNVKNVKPTLRKTNPSIKNKLKFGEPTSKKHIVPNQKNIFSKEDKGPIKQGVVSDNDLIEKMSNKNMLKRKLLSVTKSKPNGTLDDKANKTLSTEDSPKKTQTKLSLLKKNQNIKSEKFLNDKGKIAKEVKSANDSTKKKITHKLTSKLGTNGLDLNLPKLETKNTAKSSCFGNKKKQMEYILTENSTDSSDSKIKQPVSNNFPVFKPKLST